LVRPLIQDITKSGLALRFLLHAGPSSGNALDLVGSCPPDNVLNGVPCPLQRNGPLRVPYPLLKYLLSPMTPKSAEMNSLFFWFLVV